MKISNDTIGNPTRDLPACSAAPQQTALPRSPLKINNQIKLRPNKCTFFLTCHCEVPVTHVVKVNLQRTFYGYVFRPAVTLKSQWTRRKKERKKYGR
jgi:hypothetical protein